MCVEWQICWQGKAHVTQKHKRLRHPCRTMHASRSLRVLTGTWTQKKVNTWDGSKSRIPLCSCCKIANDNTAALPWYYSLWISNTIFFLFNSVTKKEKKNLQVVPAGEIFTRFLSRCHNRKWKGGNFKVKRNSTFASCQWNSGVPVRRIPVPVTTVKVNDNTFFLSWSQHLYALPCTHAHTCILGP